MKQRDYTSAKAKEALLKDKDKLCGECCWFYAEDSYGYGMCPFRFADVHECGQKCDVPLKYVSKKDMRHYMAVLLQAERWYSAINDTKNYNIVYMPNPTEYRKAIRFAFRYMKVFSKL